LISRKLETRLQRVGARAGGIGLDDADDGPPRELFAHRALRRHGTQRAIVARAPAAWLAVLTAVVASSIPIALDLAARAGLVALTHRAVIAILVGGFALQVAVSMKRRAALHANAEGRAIHGVRLAS
jgi:hypothetical protein